MGLVEHFNMTSEMTHQVPSGSALVVADTATVAQPDGREKSYLNNDLTLEWYTQNKGHHMTANSTPGDATIAVFRGLG